jgi:hypothetical protein
MLTRKMFESRLSEMPFPQLWGEILQNSDGQKRHCDISEALAQPRPMPFMFIIFLIFSAFSHEKNGTR